MWSCALAVISFALDARLAKPFFRLLAACLLSTPACLPSSPICSFRRPEPSCCSSPAGQSACTCVCDVCPLQCNRHMSVVWLTTVASTQIFHGRCHVAVAACLMLTTCAPLPCADSAAQLLPVVHGLPVPHSFCHFSTAGIQVNWGSVRHMANASSALHRRSTITF